MKIRAKCGKCDLLMECFPVMMSDTEYYQCPFCKTGFYLEEVFERETD